MNLVLTIAAVRILLSGGVGHHSGVEGFTLVSEALQCRNHFSEGGLWGVGSQLNRNLTDVDGTKTLVPPSSSSATCERSGEGTGAGL